MFAYCASVEDDGSVGSVRLDRRSLSPVIHIDEVEDVTRQK